MLKTLSRASERALHRLGAWVAPIVLSLPAWVGAQAIEPATLADCREADPHRVLLAAPSADAVPEHARAIWLSQHWIRWPGMPATGRYRLAHSASGRLQGRPGQPVQGADDSWALQSSAAALPPTLAQRFRYLSAGATLTVPAQIRQSLRGLLRGQLLLLREDDQGRVLDSTRLQNPGVLDDLYAAAEHGSELGATVWPAGRPVRQARNPVTHYRLWAPTAQAVALCLYSDEQGPAEALLPMRPDAATGIWAVLRRANDHGRAYDFLVDVWVPGVGLVRNRVTDPYSLSLAPDSKRSVVIDPNEPDTQPPGWRGASRPQTVRAPTDQVIYELHVRDFSANDPSVPAALRGRYEAFALPDSHGVRHLKALASAGMTDVHLLPVFDLATVPEQGCIEPAIAQAAPDSDAQQAAAGRVRSSDCYNWGYDPWHFSAPEGSFATPGASGVQRIREFRRMVQALHGLGLRVGMDVVYNHTSASGQHLHSVLDRIVPGYYQRLDAQGRVERSTCCDNTATEHRMMARLMIDSAVVWAREHRIDSFRFDLMGHQPREAMERLQRAVNRAAGQHIHLIGEGWNFGEVADGRRFVQASQLSLNGSGIATFNDRLRDAVRGGRFNDGGIDQIVNQGYVSGLHANRNERAAATDRGTRQDLLQAADLIRSGLAGSIRGYVLEDHRGERLPLERLRYGKEPAGYVTQPHEVVNYVENHDNQTLFDNLAFKLPLDTPPDERARVQTLAQAILLLSQGIAYVHAGQELLRSKSMDRNSFDSGDWFNRIDWTGQDNYFGTGLPPREENFASWPQMQPILARAADIRPRPQDIAFARDAFLDMLRIRSSTTLLRLRTAGDIQSRLTLHNTGPRQNPVLLAGHVEGRGYAGAGFAELLYLVNVDTRAHLLTLEGLKGRAFELHPVHRAATAADPRPVREARHERDSGSFLIPARTALVYVVR
jgi:pullulanase